MLSLRARVEGGQAWPRLTVSRHRTPFGILELGQDLSHHKVAPLQDWNVVVSVRQHGFRRACDLLGMLGPVSRTEFFNVLVMRVDDIPAFLDALQALLLEHADAREAIARAIPATRTFLFQSPEEFEAEACKAVTDWLPALEGRAFHVRMHRRGFRGRLSSQAEERFLDGYLLASMEQRGSPGHIAFEDPDAVVAVETVGQRAGLSLWHRDELRKYPFLAVD